jgi:hypothetical protein
MDHYDGVTSVLIRVEPMTGIEPAYSAWEADVLPLNYIGTASLTCRTPFSEPAREAQCHTISQLAAVLQCSKLRVSIQRMLTLRSPRRAHLAVDREWRWLRQVRTIKPASV